ncbi:hypothetical protein N8A98_07040 [Devosia neptuniae]|uniref:Uncharacterized protein n=1 Tax=Devosia neptuniae TaxID=191302 RepID=A0ABY6CFR1_9HYPH|nr:hypothetical protein [Devosia neptuniae]UXN70937.1 hypothetical protein N8A98_07040 [Devosia neptuniae]
MGWPQITIIVLIALSVGINLAMHGKPRTGTHNVGYSILGSAIWLVPLYYGGFFTA